MTPCANSRLVTLPPQREGVRRKHPVITSYSIHYTKLYELTGGVAGLTWMFGHPRQKAATFITKVDSYKRDIASIIRIV